MASKLDLACAALLSTAAVTLSLTYNLWDYPDQWSPDEVTGQAQAFAAGELRPTNYYYGALPALWQAAALVAAKVAGIDVSPGGCQWAARLIARSSSAALFGFAVGLGFLAWTHRNRMSALAFAGLIAFNPLMVNLSHYATVEPMLLAAAVGAVSASAVCWRHPRGSTLLAASVAVGCATGIKTYSVSLLPLPLTVALLASWTDRSRALNRVLMVFLALLAGYVVAQPFVLVDPHRWLRDQVANTAAHRSSLDAYGPLFGPARYAENLGRAVGLPAVVLGVLGLSMTLWGTRERGLAGGLAASVMGALAIFFGARWVALRFAVPAVPVVVALATLGVERLIDRGAKGIAAVAVALALAHAALYSAMVLGYFAKDARVQARQWLAKVVSPGDVVLTLRYSITPPSWARHITLTEVRRPLAPSQVRGLRAWVRLKSLITGESFDTAWQRQWDFYRERMARRHAYEQTASPLLFVRERVKWVVYDERFLDAALGPSADPILAALANGLSSGRLGYKLAAVFDWHVAGLTPPTEFVNPRTYVYVACR